jgi:hypothetical protein
VEHDEKIERCAVSGRSKIGVKNEGVVEKNIRKGEENSS